MSFSQHEQAPYRMRHERMEGNRVIPTFSITCGKCHQAILDTTMNPDSPPEAVLQKLRNKGKDWLVSQKGPSRHRCPACNHPQRTTAPTCPIQEPIIMAPAPKAPPVKERPIGESTGPLPTLSPEQKRLVRAELDGTFDEAVGHYIDGYSDKSIGEKLNLPWAAVAALREVAYGPISIDPALQKLMDSMAVAEARVLAAHEVAKTAANAVADARNELDLMRQRLQAYRKA